jgi:hypothetical protein
MLTRISKALAGTLALCALAATTAGAAIHVTVRIEGAKRTLLQTTRVTVPTRGFVTKFGAPAGACPATNYAGAFDRAVRGHWSGSWSSQFNELSVISILGESHPFSSPLYWAEWTNHKYNSVGICEQRIHNGDNLLIYADPTTGDISPLGLRTPHHARAGHPVSVQVVSFDGSSGKASPVAGAIVRGGAAPVTTDKSGHASVTFARAGRGALRAVATGHMRSEIERVGVSR